MVEGLILRARNEWTSTDLTRDLEALRDDASRLDRGRRRRRRRSTRSSSTSSARRAGSTLVLRGIGALPAEDRPKVGAIANEVREAIEAALAERGGALRGAELESRLAAETVDVTTPGRPIRRGRLHPIIETIARSPRSSASSGSSPTRAPRSRTT